MTPFISNKTERPASLPKLGNGTTTVAEQDLDCSTDFLTWVRGGEPAGPPADVYGLAAVGCHLLSGKPIFDVTHTTEFLMAHLHSEPYNPQGGPDGGDGGRGGDVVLRVDPSMFDLSPYRDRRRHRSADGRPGASSNRTGAPLENARMAPA